MNPIQSLTKNLVSYLLANVLPTDAGGKAIPLQVLGEWPGANQKLSMPSITVTTGQPKFTNLMPYQIGDPTAPDADKKVITTLCVGEYDVQYQFDLWCRNKLERETIFGLFMGAINKQLSDQGAMGLRIQLTDYFNEWATVCITDHQFVDDEAGAQRQEWRVKVTGSANVKMVQQVTNYAMITFDTEVVTPDTLP